MATRVKQRRAISALLSTPQEVVAPAPSTKPKSFSLISDAKLKQLYATMLQCRIFEEHAHSLRGLETAGKARKFSEMEAAIVGAVVDLRREDWLLSSPRTMVAGLVKGAPLASLLPTPSASTSRRKGDRASKLFPARNDGYLRLHVTPAFPDSSSQLNAAIGLALASKARADAAIVIAICDDVSPSTSQAALRYAGEHCLPLLVVASKSTPPVPDSLSRKASRSLGEDSRCEVPRIPVDAADVVAVYRVAFESIHKARNGGGPTVIEAVNHPLGKTIRPAKQPLGASEPLSRMESYLSAKGLFSPAWKQGLIETFHKRLQS